MSKIAAQLRWLVWKNFKVAQRNKCSSLFQFISPLIVCLMVLGFQALSDAVIAYDQVQPPVHPILSSLSRCTLPNDCTTIGYGILGTETPWVQYTIDQLSHQTGLTKGVDIQKQYQGLNMTKYNDYFLAHPNKTDLALLFCTSPLLCNAVLHKKGDMYQYAVIYNKTNLPAQQLFNTANAAPKADRATSLKVLVDDILANYLSTHPLGQPYRRQFQLTQQEYPKVTSRLLKGYDVMSAQGSFYFLIPPIFTFLFFTNEMLKEKELKLRQYMEVVGVATWVYWLSWVITMALVSLLQSIIMALSGVIFQFSFFLDTPFLFLVLLFFVFTFSMQFVALFIVTVSTDLKQGNSIAYGFLLMSWVIQILLSNVLLIYGLYQNIMPTWVYFVRGILTCYPPFNFAKVWGDITQYAGSHWDINTNMWVQGTGYHWSYISHAMSGHYGPKHTFSTPSTGSNLGYMVMDLLIFFVAALYFDQVLAHNRGQAKPWYFFIDFRTCFSKQNKIEEKAEELNLSQDHQRSLIEGQSQGLIVKNIKKTFGGGCLGTKQTRALQGVNLDIHHGELLGLLGHNGAGKTTLIQIMTGLLQADSGSVNVCGLDLSAQLNSIRQIIGVCPQFDILWNELTAGEHLLLYDHLKPIETTTPQDKYINILQTVGLQDVIHKPVGTFSGGMKRRLSMTIAGMNSPQVVFLDEPTTGMDPVSRRAIWDMVLQLKKDRIVLLTTHSMEEADVLSDQVAVMVDGMVQCSGTALELKNKYGKGYRLTIIAKLGHEVTLHDHLLQKVLPSAGLVDRSACQLIYSIEHSHLDELRRFVSQVEQPDEHSYAQHIEEWGLSNSTLEEVFMRVTNKKNQ